MRNRRFLIWWLGTAVIVLLVVLYRLEADQQPVAVVHPTQFPSLPATLSGTPASQSEGIACKRPYPDESIWNVPIDWSVAKIHPMSDLMINAFFASEAWVGA